MNSKNLYRKRVLMTIIGVSVCGVSVGFFKMAAFGVDPFQSFMSGLSSVIPISFGTLYTIVNAVMLLFSLVADRHYIGLGTFVNLFLMGYIVQYSHEFLMKMFPQLGLSGRCLFLLIAIVVMCLSSSLYFTADMGVSVYDAVALIISYTWKKGQFRYNRIMTDLVCVIIGVTLFFLSGGKLSGIGAVAGIGTIITAFFMGPLIDFFNRKVAQPLLGVEH
ncbi:MAG: hypothetical protein MJ097_06085 [Dorea sp.]|nr:hypothetical protein [Dorea sp.]